MIPVIGASTAGFSYGIITLDLVGARWWRAWRWKGLAEPFHLHSVSPHNNVALINGER